MFKHITVSLSFFMVFFMGSHSVYSQTLTSNPVQTLTKNLDSGVNALLLGRMGSLGNSPLADNPNGFQLQELELRFTSNIDAFLRGDITLAIESEDGEFIIEPEEAFVETLFIPSFTLKAGKFFANFGRHNSLHAHSFPFIDAPITNTYILGDEGLNEVGLSVSYLVPTPWYFEIIGQGLSASNDTLFGSPTNDDLAAVLFVKNLWELSDTSTLEFDLGYSNGKNSLDGTTHLYNSSLTYKWRPLEKSTSRSFSWTTEFLLSDRENSPTDKRVGGISSWAQLQLKKQWLLQARAEHLGLPKPDDGDINKYSALIGFVPSEFSMLRFQYDYIDDASQTKEEHRLSLQLNISMGSHPAHEY